MTHLRKVVIGCLIAVCTTAALGCGDSTAPTAGTLSDPKGLSADVGSLDTAFTAPVLQSFGTIALTGTGTPLARTAALLGAMSPARVQASLSRRALPRHPAFAVAALRPAFASGSIIPATVWGKTYVWDGTVGHYVEGAGGSAPANGVRFILYAINPLTQQPATPLNAVGYADLTDQSSAGTARLAVTVVGGGVTYADYTVTASATASSFSAQAEGYITDGTRRLDFTNSAAATPSQVTLDYQLAVNQPIVTARLQATLAIGDPTSTLTVNFRVTRGSESVVIAGALSVTTSGSSSAAAADLAITVNGSAFATITGTAQSGGFTSYTVRGPNGRELTQDERDALKSLLEAPSRLSDVVEHLFHPAEELLSKDYQLELNQ